MIEIKAQISKAQEVRWSFTDLNKDFIATHFITLSTSEETREPLMLKKELIQFCLLLNMYLIAQISVRTQLCLNMSVKILF